jgi:Na+/melibiose symporter-like transporter
MAKGSLLRQRDFRLVAGSVGLSALGDWVAIIPLGLFVQAQTDSGFAVAALWFCLFGPSALLAGHAGLLVDRVETTRLLAATSALGAAASVALVFADGVELVLALTVVLGVVFAIAQPAEFSLVPLLSGEDRVQEANGHVESARYIGFAIGPVLGGLLYAAGGLELPMAVNAVSFATVAVVALSLRVRRRAAELGEGEQQPRARDGVAYLFRDRTLSLAMVVAFVSLLFMSAVWVAEVFFVKEVLDQSDTAYGLLLTTWTVAMLAGSLLVAPRVAAAAVASVGFAAVVVQGSGLFFPALWLSFGFMLACAVVGGLGHGVKNVMFRTLIHVRVPESLHGRAFAAYNGIRNAAELGAFAAGGLLVVAIGARGTLAYAGGLSALAGLIGLAVLVRMNRGWRPSGPVGPPVDSLSLADEAPGPAAVAPEAAPASAEQR